MHYLAYRTILSFWPMKRNFISESGAAGNQDESRLFFCNPIEGSNAQGDIDKI